VLATDLGDDGARLIDGVLVRCFEQRHPGGSYAYSLEKDGHKVVYATDNELDLTLADTELPVRDPAAQRLLPARFVEFCRGADLLIADGQYTDQEYVKYSGWGHARATTVVDLAIQAGVKQLAVYHHDPMQSDREVEAKIEACRQRAARMGAPLFIFAAREGIEIKLD
jgi:ribonuclease BN (tRNA processing enzyme)